MEKRNKIFISGDNCKESYKVVLNYLPNHLHKESKIIDIGCGDLSFCKILSKYCSNVTGVDIYHKTSNEIKTLTRDLNKPWLINKKYDIIISTSVIEHVENPYHFFRELRKLMTKNSIAIIYTDNINYYYSKLLFLLFNYHSGFNWKLDNMRTSKSLHLNDQWHKSPMNKEELIYKAKMCGLSIVDVLHNPAQIKYLPFVKPIRLKKISSDILSQNMCIVLKKNE